MADIEIPVVQTIKQENNLINTTLSKCEQRCLSWFALITGILVPVMIALATIVIALQQQREANLTRTQDLEIEERRYKQTLEIEGKRYEKDRGIEDRQYERERATNLYHQNVYQNYIEDISNVLFKTNSTIIENEIYS
jgi:hypothetical protein